MKLMKIVTYWQRVRIVKDSAEVVGEAVACSELVRDIVRCSVVRAGDVDNG